VTPGLTEVVFATFLIFCRIGACLMVMPGFSTQRVQPQIRLLIALAITVAVAPLLLPGMTGVVRGASNADNIQNIFTELLIGGTIGLMGRYFFLALQFAAIALATYIGLGGAPMPSIDEVDPAPALANLVTLTATVLFFLTEQHLEVIKALVSSYNIMPVSEGFDVQNSVTQLTRTLGVAFVLAVQITSPFIVFSIAVNFLFGLLNIMTPQIQVYFISIPFVAAGGLLFVYFFINEVMRIFTEGFMTWLQRGA
jgi:flagellar biosynthetic protein FliR